jgi:hypothetical protein
MTMRPQLRLTKKKRPVKILRQKKKMSRKSLLKKLNGLTKKRQRKLSKTYCERKMFQALPLGSRL